jgi:hypothetical protein
MHFGAAIYGDTFWLIESFVLPDLRKRCGSFSSPSRCQLQRGNSSPFRLPKIIRFCFGKHVCRILKGHNALLRFVVATAHPTARRQQFWGCAFYVGLKRHIRLHWQILIQLVVGVKYAVVGLLGYVRCILSGAAIGRSYHREGYMGDLHQLDSSAAWQLGKL